MQLLEACIHLQLLLAQLLYSVRLQSALSCMAEPHDSLLPCITHSLAAHQLA